ncbi:hypothetical protein RSAG8_08304, partial [Rhizoctonia solani AG-8 WAC10335]
MHQVFSITHSRTNTIILTLFDLSSCFTLSSPMISHVMSFLPCDKVLPNGFRSVNKFTINLMKSSSKLVLSMCTIFSILLIQSSS